MINNKHSSGMVNTLKAFRRFGPGTGQNENLEQGPKHLTGPVAAWQPPGKMMQGENPGVHEKGKKGRKDTSS
jgi:hypothetical protein